MTETSGRKPKAHILSRLDSDLQALKERVVEMGQLVQEQVTAAVDAFVRRDRAGAAQVVDRDRRVNDLELEIDERCVQALALLQPAASDLRFVAAVLKIVTDLERIGDFAVNIARSIPAADAPPLAAEGELPRLSESALGVLRRALDAFVRRDSLQAKTACTADQPVTAALVRLGAELRDEIVRDPRVLDRALSALFVTKHIERVAKHATNVAEMALYTERGEDVRHLTDRTGGA